MNNYLIDIRPYDERFFGFRQLINWALKSEWAYFAKLAWCFMEVNFSPVLHEASWSGTTQVLAQRFYHGTQSPVIRHYK